MYVLLCEMHAIVALCFEFMYDVFSISLVRTQAFPYFSNIEKHGKAWVGGCSV
jgi:hypothetical protein